MSSLILVVDDISTNLTLCKKILGQAGYRTCFAQSGHEALERAKAENPDLILLDVMMPGMDGYEVCRILKNDKQTRHIPVVFLTALEDESDETEGFAVGAVDYILKPISAPRLLARVRNQLSLVRMELLEKTQRLIVEKLGRAAEYKDNETGFHVIRMSHYSRILALALGLPECQADLLFHAAPMHDVGKIGTPDYILLKQDKLSPEEWEIMKQHPAIGADIIGEHPIPLLQSAREIALTHHEKWDGSGYPRGLKGEEIPLFGRIVAIADVFDALASRRPYKRGWSLDDTCKRLKDDAGTHFDPELVEVFLRPDTLAKVKTIYAQWPDE
ncbi:response regulator [Shewanella corallii]|uniref:Response regulator n=1 Tax=Shewanella corallii TaxID=560080 RepID=A0ABT0NAG9_9GAMM|nr:HD domain-containing phosphohydrolase [Shewanella corallii]MCL2915408.1 response regulator [Shewanella corallii]